MRVILLFAIGILLNLIGFSRPELWPWVLFNAAGGCFVGQGIVELLKLNVPKRDE